jgi:hypothetical protein
MFPPLPSICYAICPSLVVLLNGSLKRLWVCADNLSNFLSVPEQQKCRHGANAELLSYVWHIIDIELVESGLIEFIGEPPGLLA